MNIITDAKDVKVKEKLPQIINRIFDICKHDENFQLKEKLQETENEINDLLEKIKKKDKVINEATTIRKGLENRVNTLEQQNIDVKTKSLEALGSEI